ncbi:MAG: oligoendopeptidase F, partial [Defluviitaleaceae bacterium]|nr:oligoendopeptidase F [Defluviitaleaceae bacterium]
AFENIYSMIHDADMKFGSVINESGDSVELTHGRFIRLLESDDPRVRRETFEAYYDSYWKQKNTIAAAFGASVKKDVFFASTRGYESALDMALFEHNIPKDVYLNLIGTVRRFLPELHRYTRLRKRALGLSELHMYDLYVPIVASVDEKVPYAEGKRTMLEGLAPLGSEYTNTARKGLEDGWVDVYENEGKRSGAYSWGSYGCHPYILMNYEDKLDDMFTLAHEVGHAMHSHYSWESQPGVYGDYTIFLAEVASTVNEILLMERLLSQTEDKKKRAYLINQTLEQFRTTVFRQTMFAEFEMAAHDLAEKGEPLTADSLNGIYRKLNEDYYGPDIMLDEKIDLEWGRIPHFYNAFYVYQYATGYSAAVAFANRIKNDSGGEAVKGYIEFLKSGGSAYSIEILKKAGVDMSEPAPVEEALDVFKGLLDQMEGLVDAEGKS